MKNFRRIVVAVLAVIMICSITLTVFAATASRNGLELSVTTDKTGYSATEKITVTVTVTNTNGYSVNNVAITSMVPDGYSTVSGYSSTKNVATLGAGETATLKVVYAPKSQSGNAPDYPWWAPGVGPGTGNTSNSNDVENEGAVEVDTPTEGATNQFEDVEVVVKNNAGLWVLLAVLSGVGLVLTLIGRKYAKKLLAIVLCVAIVGTIAMAMPVETHAVMALEAGGVKNLNAATEITVNGVLKQVNATVSWSDNSVDEVPSDKEEYLNNAELLEIISATESDEVMTETEAKSLLTDKGFGENPISYDYSIDGNRVDDTEVADGSTNVHPMYQTLYLSSNGEAWAIYIINGSIFANPVSFNLESDLGVMLLISESETLTSYDDETNQFYVTIPHMSVTILHTVAKIDSVTLDGLTTEEICRLTGATVSDDDEDIYNSEFAEALALDEPYTVALASADARYSSEDPLIVVSLGDSYSSGESIEKFYGQDKDLNDKVRDDNWLAHRSTKGWPALLKVPGMSGTTADHMVSLGTTSTSTYQWYFAAASGATTWHLQNSFKKEYHRSTGWFSAVEGSKSLPRQLDAFNGLQGKVDYVTLSIGGNDVGFADVVITCAINCANLHFGATSKLEDQLADTWANFSTTKANIKKAYKDIQAAAGSQAAIIVVGYPQLLEPNGKGFVINKTEAQLVNSNVSLFNDEIEGIVNECRQSGMNIYFVDVESAFTGHQAYSNSPWINKIIFGKQEQDLSDKGIGSAYSVHPNAQGAKAYAELVNATIKEIENSKINQMSSITGVITIADTDTDMSNNLPLEGATVTIEYASFMDFVAISDAMGQYHIGDVPAGTYRLTVTKEGYIPVTETIVVPEDGSEVIYNIAIEAISEGYSGIGYASGTVYDVSTGIGIAGLTLNIYRGLGVTTGDVTLTTTTTNGGRYATQGGIEAGNYTVVVVDERSGISDESRYTTASFNIKVLGGMTIDNQNGYVSNGITSDNIRVVLSWGSTPSDLDSHLVGPTSAGGTFHVYYRNDTYGNEVDLDRDDTDSYGPETITIRSINNGIYTYAVHNYSDRGSSSSTSLSTSGAQVKVYRGAELIMTYNAPTGMDGTLWTVFSYDANTQRFTTINSMSYDNSNGEGVLQGTARSVLNLDSENAVIWIAQDMIMSDVSANAK